MSTTGAPAQTTAAPQGAGSAPVPVAPQRTHPREGSNLGTFGVRPGYPSSMTAGFDISIGQVWFGTNVESVLRFHYF